MSQPYCMKKPTRSKPWQEKSETYLLKSAGKPF